MKLHYKYYYAVIIPIVILGFMVNSCANYKCRQHKYTSFSKTEIYGKPIGHIFSIYEFENYEDLLLANLQTNTGDTNFINFKEYELEDRYFLDVREIKYSETDSPRGGDFVEDSLKKYYPLQKKPKKINILTDNKLKFIEEYLEYNIEDYLEYDNIPRVTLKSIIKPNKAYIFSWDKGKWELSGNRNCKINISTSLQIETDSNRNITKWEEVKSSYYYKELPGRSVKGRL